MAISQEFGVNTEIDCASEFEHACIQAVLKFGPFACSADVSNFQCRNFI